MRYSLLKLTVFFFLVLLFISLPFRLQAVEADSYPQEIETDEIVEVPLHLSQKELNDLFGEDPYLGQTSYLQSPDGFSQREKSK